MFARLLALVCLGGFGIVICRSEPVTLPNRKVVVYLQDEASQPTGPVVAMKREVASLLTEAGYTIEWREHGSSTETDGFLTVLELRGVCETPDHRAVESVLPGAKLASTAVTDGRILPFSWVNCETLTQFLTPVIMDQPDARREFLYGRAMGRVVAHELYHILSNEPGHDEGGVAKPSFTTRDILADQFNFNHATLAKLEARPASPASDDPPVLFEQSSGPSLVVLQESVRPAKRSVLR